MRKANSKRAAYRSEWHRKKKYGITTQDLEYLKKKQKGRCKICRKKLPTRLHRGRSNLHVDHDHKTGKVRGLLCFHCNTGLGHFKDDKKVLKSAIRYLEAA